MATGRMIEVETKYQVKAPGGADRYLVAPELGFFAPAGPVRSVRLEDRYIDSADWALARAGFAARLRRTSRGTRISLKALGSSGARLQRREEVEGPANASLIPADWPSSQARTLVLKVCGAAALVDLLTIRQLRRIRPLRAGRTRVELSVDEVEIVGDGQVLDAFEELEVELKGGNEAPLAALAELLDRDDGMRPVSSSKLERAVETIRAAMPSMSKDLRKRWLAAPPELLTSKSRPPAGAEHEAEPEAGPAPETEPVNEVGPTPTSAPNDAPAAGPTPKPGSRKLGVHADDSLPEAALKVLGFHFARMQNREAGTRSGLEIEDLHAMRVATRRMRAAWRVFDDAFKAGKTKKLRRRLETIADRLGAARDLDVLTEGLEAYRLGLDEDQRPGLEPLASLWRQQREAAGTDLVRELDSKRYESFVKEMAAFLDAGASAASSVATPTEPHRLRDRAPSEVWATYQAVRAYELVLPWADIETLHNLRISTKWLRYALEFFGETLGPDGDPLLAKVAALQDHLGSLHDADVAAKLAREVLLARAGDLSKIERRAIGAYLRSREREVARRRRSLGPVWRAVNGAPFRRALGRATASL